MYLRGLRIIIPNWLQKLTVSFSLDSWHLEWWKWRCYHNVLVTGQTYMNKLNQQIKERSFCRKNTQNNPPKEERAWEPPNAFNRKDNAFISRFCWTTKDSSLLRVAYLWIYSLREFGYLLYGLLTISFIFWELLVKILFYAFQKTLILTQFI